MKLYAGQRVTILTIGGEFPALVVDSVVHPHDCGPGDKGRVHIQRLYHPAGGSVTTGRLVLGAPVLWHISEMEPV